MVTCWAACLDDCSGVQSREHYLSSTIIGSGNVVVSGFHFLKGATRTIPGDRLVAKMLCERHNTALSPADSAAGHFCRVLSAFKHRGAMRAQGARKPGGIDMYDIDGAAVEQWMLKTLINVEFDRDLGSDGKWRPPDLWVQCAFGRTAFPAKCGLYMLKGESSAKLSEEPAIGIRPLSRSADEDTLVGGQFRIVDLQFAISMIPLHKTHERLYRLKALKDKPSLDLKQIVRFDWSSVAAG